MTDTHVPVRGEDEPEQLREQFRQLLRYRWLIGTGVGVGLLAGAWLGITGADSYAATTDLVLRAPTSDPFAPTLATALHETSGGVDAPVRKGLNPRLRKRNRQNAWIG